jgi:alcohol dehydrogenase class IV
MSLTATLAGAAFSSWTDVGGKAEDIADLATTAISLQRLVDLSPITRTIKDAKKILEASL